MQRKLPLLLGIFMAVSFASAADKAPKTDTLIVPGEGIGIMKIGDRTDAVDKAFGEPDYSDAAMGKGINTWYLGAKKGDKGRPFHRPDEIGCWCHRDEEGHHYLISQAEVTSPKYATAEGIAPGSSLTAISARYPDLKIFSDDPDKVKSWPPFGEVRIYQDSKEGIAFAIRKSDEVCVQIIVTPKGEDNVRNSEPAATTDYDLNTFEGSVGDLKLGMSGADILKLLGEPDEKRNVFLGSLWRWRLPSQGKDELPALCVYMTPLPGGVLIAGQIRVTSPFFHLNPTITPGCTVAEMWGVSARGPVWIEEFAPEKGKTVDIYGDLLNGVLFEVRREDGICSAITLTSPAIDILQSVAAHAQLPVGSKGASAAPGAFK